VQDINGTERKKRLCGMLAMLGAPSRELHRLTLLGKGSTQSDCAFKWYDAEVLVEADKLVVASILRRG
jgi:hypothetical protein